MPSRSQRLFRIGAVVSLFFALGLSAVFASFSFDSSRAPLQPAPKAPPQAAPAALTAKKNYLSWNPLDLFLTGRLVVGFERMFHIGSRYFGLYVQYASPMNSVFKGLVTANQNPTSLSDEIQFPSGIDVYLNYYGKGRNRGMRYFPRVGLNFSRNPGQTERGIYAAFGPCGRVAFGNNFHVTFALTTLKIKIAGNNGYNWIQFPLFDFMVGVDF